jgi:hypothetical protein
MSTFGELATAFKKIDLNTILNQIFSESIIQTWIKETVTGRLRDDGVTGSGKKLQTDRSKEQGTKAYAYFTEYLRDKIGKQTGHVDLIDTGSLHQSFKTIVKQKSFETFMNWNNQIYDNPIYINFTQMYGTEDEFYNDVESLTDDEIDELLENKVYPELIKRIDAIF